MMMCDKNCFKCPYPDCINDDVDAYDVHISEVMDKQLVATVNPNDRIYKYNHSYKNKLAQKRYHESEKGKEANSETENSESVDDMLEKIERILSDDEMAKEYYAKNKDAINERRRKRYQEKKLAEYEKDKRNETRKMA